MTIASLNLSETAATPNCTTGEFVNFEDERCYLIRNYDRLPPFFINLVSHADHWLFVSSTGGLTAGRGSQESALFPYLSVDQIHDSAAHTGPKTIVRGSRAGAAFSWEPFNLEHSDRFALTRNLYKSRIGNKLWFEEINHDLEAMFRYQWAFSEEFGVIRQCELVNLGHAETRFELLDGLQNILPAATPRLTQTLYGNLVDAYKTAELEPQSGLALYALNAAISDRAEPCESLTANVVWCQGLESPTTLLSSAQLESFRAGSKPQQELEQRGVRGAYFVHATIKLRSGHSKAWRFAADLDLSQAEVLALQQALQQPDHSATRLNQSIAAGNDRLAAILAASDGYQATAEETVVVHHQANVLFNVLRGGYFFDQYQLPSADFAKSVAHFSKPIHKQHADFLSALPTVIAYAELLERVQQQNDPQLIRLCREYLPVTFGRRHGDPSRPWNLFSIHLKDDAGNPRLFYEGNWRDIFQNWEALAFSFPSFVENMIAKFVNASTRDGYNPYRISKQGIDWEVEDLEDPWSYIGYWGDHQIIYLLKLLELSRAFYPERLSQLLGLRQFAYANVPYRIRSFDALLTNPKETIDFDPALAKEIDQLEAQMGADARLVLDEIYAVLQVNLLEKLLVPLLCKLGNFVLDGGIWLNTQRPEWNDANNALVGHGLSVVTLCYLRRYVHFLHTLLAEEEGSFPLSVEVDQWLTDTATAFLGFQTSATDGKNTDAAHKLLLALGQSADGYRQRVYERAATFETRPRTVVEVRQLLETVLPVLDRSIRKNQRDDGLYHAYNIADIKRDGHRIEPLYPMLEGQVAVLSSAVLSAEESATLLDTLFASDLYRQDQHSFMLYPDRPLPRFLEKNRIPSPMAEEIPLLRRLRDEGVAAIASVDINGEWRFHAQLKNATCLQRALDELPQRYQAEVKQCREQLLALYENVFNHQAFTGRSGTMFGFEGLGCIYWHMVSKLLLAVQEIYFAALSEQVDSQTLSRIAQHYYRIRQGIGFNKSPEEYGAFPTDPYSHTPGHAGAQQPGMTGQVKEEILTRFGELGLRIEQGRLRIEPRLLRQQEFARKASSFRYLDVHGGWRTESIPANALGFTWCQLPFVYHLEATDPSTLEVEYCDGRGSITEALTLDDKTSREIFERSGVIRQINVRLHPRDLCHFGQSARGLP